MIHCSQGTAVDPAEAELEQLALSFVNGTLTQAAQSRVDAVLHRDGRFWRIVAEVLLLRQAVHALAGTHRRAIPFAPLRLRIRAQAAIAGCPGSAAGPPAGGGIRKGVASGSIRE